MTRIVPLLSALLLLGVASHAAEPPVGLTATARVLTGKVRVGETFNVQLRIEGNADDSGSDEYNVALSQRRAAIAHRYFTDRGIDGSRLRITAFGEERPACTTSREEDCRSKNRRDEFVILAGF